MVVSLPGTKGYSQMLASKDKNPRQNWPPYYPTRWGWESIVWPGIEAKLPIVVSYPSFLRDHGPVSRRKIWKKRARRYIRQWFTATSSSQVNCSRVMLSIIKQLFCLGGIIIISCFSQILCKEVKMIELYIREFVVRSCMWPKAVWWRVGFCPSSIKKSSNDSLYSYPVNVPWKVWVTTSLIWYISCNV